MIGIPFGGRLQRGVVLASVMLVSACGQPPTEVMTPSAQASRPALTVALVSPQWVQWPQTLSANGTVAAWEEIIIGAELANERLSEVHAQVGDRVKKGALLAQLDDQAIRYERDQAEGAVLEQAAALQEARANAQRAKALQEKGFYSAQMAAQSLATEQMAAARLVSAQARRDAAQLRLDRTRIVAPDAGEISSRSATVGSLVQPGQALFRLIRQGRLEWRAEMPGTEMAAASVGLPVVLQGPTGESIQGKIRALSPALEVSSRNGLVYVDLPKPAGLKAGMFVRGQVELGKTRALVVPQSALVMRDGFAYLFRVDGALTADPLRVAQIKVETGRRQGAQVEIVQGLGPDVRVVASGAGFLADGDWVKVTP